MSRLEMTLVRGSLCAALGIAGCLHERAAHPRQGNRGERPAASVARVERPASFPSRWDATNWDARASAFAKAGLVEVQLTRLLAEDAPPVTVAPGTWCQLLDQEGSDGRRFIFSLSGEFGMSSDGTIHCLKIDMPELGNKEVDIDGTPPNCGGGAYRQHVPLSTVYEVPARTPVGKMKQLSVSVYNVAHRYKEQCPPLP